MAINKVVYGDEVLIDLTEDTVTADVLLEGYSAHTADGNIVVGTYPVPVLIAPIEFDYNIGYIANGVWTYENPTNTYTDMYAIEKDHTYLCRLGAIVGTRFRAMSTPTDIRTVTSGKVNGTARNNVDKPEAYSAFGFTALKTEYLYVAKDNVGKQNVITRLYDITNLFRED